MVHKMVFAAQLPEDRLRDADYEWLYLKDDAEPVIVGYTATDDLWRIRGDDGDDLARLEDRDGEPFGTAPNEVVIIIIGYHGPDDAIL